MRGTYRYDSSEDLSLRHTLTWPTVPYVGCPNAAKQDGWYMLQRSDSAIARNACTGRARNASLPSLSPQSRHTTCVDICFPACMACDCWPRFAARLAHSLTQHSSLVTLRLVTRDLAERVACDCASSSASNTRQSRVGVSVSVDVCACVFDANFHLLILFCFCLLLSRTQRKRLSLL